MWRDGGNIFQYDWYKQAEEQLSPTQRHFVEIR